MCVWLSCPLYSAVVGWAALSVCAYKYYRHMGVLCAAQSDVHMCCCVKVPAPSSAAHQFEGARWPICVQVRVRMSMGDGNTERAFRPS